MITGAASDPAAPWPVGVTDWEPVLSFENVRLGFEEGDVLRGLSFTLAHRETKILLGETGSGKTLVLKLAAGLLLPDSGHVRVFGRDLSSLSEPQLHQLRRQFGFVFQEGALFDSLTVGENVAFRMNEENVAAEEVDERVQEALRHYDDFGNCMFCQMIEEELQEKHRIVLKTEHFVVMELFASPTPFGTHIYPLRHTASFSDISPAEIVDLARTLRTVMAKLYYGLGDPDFNYTIRSAPSESAGSKYFHWYLSVIPRLTRMAGFELGSGMFINTVLPEAAAEFLRNVQVESAAGAGV